MINVLKELEYQLKKLGFYKIDFTEKYCYYMFQKRYDRFIISITIEQSDIKNKYFQICIKNETTEDYIFSKQFFINKITDIDCIQLINRIKMFFSLFNDLFV